MKLKITTLQNKKSAFTLVELLIAMTMLSIIILVISTTISQIYFQQKKITLRQNFHNEARFLTEKVVQLVRNNTLDYDRYFVEYSASACGSFQNLFNPTTGNSTNTQIPRSLQEAPCVIAPGQPTPSTTDCPDGYLYDATTNSEIDNVGDANLVIDEGKHNRETLGYENIFYWDTNNDRVPDRQLGGFNPSGGFDLCTSAFDPSTTIQDLYLINGSRTIRTQIEYIPDTLSDGCDDGECLIQISRELARDTDGDKKVDEWVTDCDINNGIGDTDFYDDPLILNLPDTSADSDAIRKYCQRAHELVNITPAFLQISDLNFAPSPNYDPYLASRADFAQIQPHVFIDMSFEMKNPEQYRFSADQGPNTRLQTSASSRVFGNTRD